MSFLIFILNENFSSPKQTTFYRVLKLFNWLLKGEYSYSKSEYELLMGKKEAPLLDTDL